MVDPGAVHGDPRGMREDDGRKLDHQTLEAIRLRAVEQVARGVPAEVPPPGLLQVQPARALGDEHLLDARRGGQPGSGGQAGMAGEVIGITAIVPVGLACSSRPRNACQEALLRDGAHIVTACPSPIRRPP